MQTNRTTITMFVLCLSVMLFGSMQTSAATSDYGYTAAALELGMGARAMGAGGTGVAIADAATALRSNPGALAFLIGHNLISSYSQDWGQVTNFSAGYAGNGIGLGVMRISSGGIEELDEYGNKLGSFDISEQSLMAGYGLRIGSHIGIGLLVKRYSQTLPDLVGAGFTGDIGALVRLGNGALGVAWRNVRGEVRYSNDTTDAFDPSFTAGASYRLNALTLAAEMDGSATYRVGGEYVWSGLTLRAGGVKTDVFAPSLGAGLQARGFIVDYGFQSHPYLGATHRLSTTIQF